MVKNAKKQKQQQQQLQQQQLVEEQNSAALHEEDDQPELLVGDVDEDQETDQQETDSSTNGDSQPEKKDKPAAESKAADGDQTYILVAEDENDEAVELPCEDDNSILLSTVSSQFPGASGLKYRNPDTKVFRALRLVDGRFAPPEKGWTSYSQYYCVFARGVKRKADDSEDVAPKAKAKVRRCSDLIVLGLPWKITDKELREYFEKFGELEFVQVKKDPKTGQSKGFGFIKFNDYMTQQRAIASRHNIQGRWCDVRVPLSKGDEQFNYSNSEFNRKIFVGRITDEISVDDLRAYFTKFGEVGDVFIPKPFRGFAFVTFVEPEVAQSLCGEEHIIKDVSTHVSNAVPKVDLNASQNYHSGYGGAPYPVYNSPGPHNGGYPGGHGNGSMGYGSPSGGMSMGNGSGHASSRYSPYPTYDTRRPAHRANSYAGNGAPLVNSTYNSAPAGPVGAAGSPNGNAWAATPAASGHPLNAPRTDIMGGMGQMQNVPAAGGYGMGFGAQAPHYSRH